jgi:hypothetical protein
MSQNLLDGPEFAGWFCSRLQPCHNIYLGSGKPFQLLSEKIEIIKQQTADPTGPQFVVFATVELSAPAL